jgi:hypothetical protein
MGKRVARRGCGPSTTRTRRLAMGNCRSSDTYLTSSPTDGFPCALLRSCPGCPLRSCSASNWSFKGANHGASWAELRAHVAKCRNYERGELMRAFAYARESLEPPSASTHTLAACSGARHSASLTTPWASDLCKASFDRSKGQNELRPLFGVHHIVAVRVCVQLEPEARIAKSGTKHK